MTYLLDTNVCIAWLRDNQPNVVARIQRENPTDIVICAVVVAELLYGVERAAVAHRANTALQVGQLRQRFVSIPFDDAGAEEYGKIRAYLAGAGTPIGGNDLLIAAIAVANDLTLVTHNTVEFGRVPGLKLDDWQ